MSLVNKKSLPCMLLAEMLDVKCADVIGTTVNNIEIEVWFAQ